MKSFRLLVAASFWAAAVISTASGFASAQDALTGQALVDALRKGGYIVYFRHAATDWSRNDHVAAEGDWTSCDPNRMRQLSDQGRSVARRIGEDIRRLEIPVGKVLSSEYCRTRETAQLMNLGTVQPTRAIMNMRAAEWIGGREAVVQRAKRELGRHPKPGTNTVIVAHGNLMRAATGAYTVEAGAGIFTPRDETDFRLVSTLEPEDWQHLADQFAQRTP
jgi:broad specificity phosphatase PhoE